MALPLWSMVSPRDNSARSCVSSYRTSSGRHAVAVVNLTCSGLKGLPHKPLASARMFAPRTPCMAYVDGMLHPGIDGPFPSIKVWCTLSGQRVRCPFIRAHNTGITLRSLSRWTGRRPEWKRPIRGVPSIRYARSLMKSSNKFRFKKR